MKQDEYINRIHLETQQHGCGMPLICVCLFLIWAFCGCRSVKVSENTTEKRLHSELMEMLDSAIGSTKTFMQEIMARQTSLVDSFRQSHRRDSSYVVVINEKGDTVREKTIVYHEVEKDHSTQKEEKEYLAQMFYQTDSLLRIVTEKQERTDSLLRKYEKMSEKQLSKWQQIKVDYGGWAMGILMTIVATVVMTSGFWKRVVKVIRHF